MNQPTDIQLERETTIVFNEGDVDAMLWSASPSFQRKMAKLGIAPYKTAGRERGQESHWYRVPRFWIRVKPPMKRQLTEERRAKMAETARRSFSKKLQPSEDKTSGEETL